MWDGGLVDSIIAVAALRFGSVTHDVADLVLTGFLTDEWPKFEADVRRGLGLESQADDVVAAADVEKALTELRHERKLGEAANLRAWLAERNLTLGQLRGYLRRRLLRERLPDAEAADVTSAEVAAVLRAEAISSGILARCAQTLRDWHAAHALKVSYSVGKTGVSDPDRVAEIVAAAMADSPSSLELFGADDIRRRTIVLNVLQNDYELIRRTAVGDDEIASRLAAHRLDWTIVSGLQLSFANEGAARETRLHVLVDGCSMTDVGKMLDRQPAHCELAIDHAPAQIRTALRGAAPGDLVGPWREGNRWSVLHLERRIEPDPDDRRLLFRARDELVDELLEGYSAGEVFDLVPI